MKAAVLTVILLLPPLVLNATTLYLKSGVELDGKEVGRDGTIVYLETDTNTLRFPAGEVDMGKTFPQKRKGERKEISISGMPKSKREKAPAVKPAPEKPSRPEYVKHLDSREGFEVSYPSSWLKSSGAGNLLQIHDSHGKASFSVTKNRTIQTTASLSTYLKGSGSRDFLNVVRKQLPESYIAETKEISLGGRKAILMTYVYRPTTSDVPYLMAATRIICIHDSYLYVLYHETPMALYRANHNDLERIIASFTFR